MTIKELYDWAVKNNAEELNIEIQYRDGGGYYVGTEALEESEIVVKRDESIVVL